MTDIRTYEFDIGDCDVADKGKLRRYREKRDLWVEILSEDEEHSIISQINQMIWNDAVFRVINHARKLSAKGSKEGAEINGTISEFIDQSYVATQLLAVRRLSESSKRGDEISLKRLIRDMKENSDLITRETYVSHDGLPFDPGPVKRKFFEELPSPKHGSAIGGIHTSGPKAWRLAERAHAGFDMICSGKPLHTNRGQQVDPRVFDRLVKHLGACSTFEMIASKFIAHAADHVSRDKLSNNQRSVTLAQITRCHQAICRVAAFLYGPVLFIGGFSLLPHAQYGHLKYLDRPWVTAEDLKKLEAYWYRHNQSVEGWTSGDWIEKLGLKRT